MNDLFKYYDSLQDTHHTATTLQTFYIKYKSTEKNETEKITVIRNMEDQSRHLYTEQEVKRLSEECVRKDLKLENIMSNVDVELMMIYGLFPFLEPQSYHIDMINMDEKSFQFWYPNNDQNSRILLRGTI